MRKVKRIWENHLLPFVQNLFFNSFGQISIRFFGKRDNRILRYDVSLCLIFKDEGKFLKEWLDYHLTIGVDHFYLYDNNSTDDFMNVVRPYMERGLVTLIDWPYQQAQVKCYKHCLETFCNETKWIGYIDADEFICPKYASTIKEWLRHYAKFPAIVIDWLQFGTNGYIVVP